MSEDMSDIINKFKNMVDNNQIPENVMNLLNNLKNDASNKSENSNTQTPSPEAMSNFINMINQNSSDNTNNSNIDMETLLKMKNIIEKMNSKSDPRANLLLSLKPYLKESRKEKVDQYINFLKMASIMGNLNDSGLGNIFGMKNNSSGGNG